MTETVPRWIIYWYVHLHSQGKLNKSMWRRMMLLCMVEVPISNVVFSLRQRNKHFTLFCDVFEWKWGPRPRTSSHCYKGNKNAATYKKGIFVHPPWVPNFMQNLKRGWNFSFPKMFDSYRLVLKIVVRHNQVKKHGTNSSFHVYILNVLCIVLYIFFVL